ncbi:MAG: hypothetical protein WBF53_00130, partial [Litorimonas sp.]
MPALVFAVVMVISGWQTVNGLRTELVNQINDDVASLSEIYLMQGADAVDVAIAQRLELSPLNRAGAHYRFETPSGEIRAGDLPPEAARVADVTRAVTHLDPEHGPLTLRATVFQGGETLFVARRNT